MSLTQYWTLNKPNRASLYWDIPLNENFDFIDNILYKLRSSYSGSTPPSENAVNGSLWFDSLNSILNLKISTGYTQIISEYSGDIRYARLANQNLFTSIQDFTNATLRWINAGTNDAISITYVTENSRKKLQINLTNLIQFRNATDPVLDIKENSVVAYKELISTLLTLPSTVGGLPTWSLRGTVNGLEAVKNINATGQVTNLLLLSDTVFQYKGLNIFHEGNSPSILQYRSEKGNANGYASLGEDGKVPASQLPAAAITTNVDTVDGYHANANPTANTIPVLDSQRRLWAYGLEVRQTNPVNTQYGRITLHHEGIIAHQLRYQNGILYLEAENAKGLGTNSTPEMYVAGGKVWHGNNDGSGSGLDADMVDGRHFTDILSLMYPVGSLYINASVATNPATLFGFGTWVAWEPGMYLCSAGTGTDTAGTTMTLNAGTKHGEYYHQLSQAEMPSHTHPTPDGTGGYIIGNHPSNMGFDGGGLYTNTTSAGATGARGGNQSHGNMSPTVPVYVWKRTA